MRNFQARGMEHLARRLEAIGQFVPASIDEIAPDRMAKMGKMDPNLMGAPGVEPALDFRA
jgi:hypothetical protein